MPLTTIMEGLALNFRAYFKKLPSEEEKALEKQAIEHLENLQADLEKVEFHEWQPRMEKFQIARSLASKTLRNSQEARSYWVEAQNLLNSWLATEKPVTKPNILRLNAILTGHEVHDWRQKDIFTGDTPHPAPGVLNELMEEYLTEIFEKHSEDHVVLRASKARQWFLAIHPFENGNGRISQLLADFILLQNSYLPQSFFRSYEGVNGLVIGPEKRIFRTSHQAQMGFIHSVVNSYCLLLDRN